MNLTEIHGVGEKIGSSATYKKSNRHRWITCNNKRLEERKEIKKQSPFVFLPCSQTLAHFQLWKTQKKNSICKCDKNIHKVDIEIEAKEAKKYKQPDKVTVMTDVDPLYFTELSGRSVKEKFSLQQYLQDIRTVLKTRLLIGQEMDNYICIDQQFQQELQCLQKIQRRCQRYMSAFEEYLFRDHKKSMDILEKAEQEVQLTKDISINRNELSKQYGQSRLEVYFWEENWRMVKMCQMFLYQISPITWRIKHDRFHRSESGRSVVSIEPTNLLSRYKTPSEDVFLEDLIELFERDITDSSLTELYFEDPFDLIRVFRAMETQNLNALIHLESLARPMAEMTTTITVTEVRIKREISEIISRINVLENCIAEAEDRTANLEEYANYLLRDIFRDLICSEQVLYLRVFIEDAYESCIGPNDANLDSFSMMKWIERNYEELNLQLDNLPRRIIHICEREGFKQETKIIKEAEDAARKFELMHRLLDTLKRIMQSPTRKKRLPARRSMPIPLKMKPLLPPVQPTNKEVQYLAFFTDYCKSNDFEAYHVMLPDDFDLTFKSRNNNDRVEPKNDASLEQQQEEEEEVEEEEKERIIIENVTESADLFENSSCVYIQKDRINLTHYASSIT